MKQCKRNPWEDFAKKCPVGTKVQARVSKIVDFGLIVHVIEEQGENALEVLAPAVEVTSDAGTSSLTILTATKFTDFLIPSLSDVSPLVDPS